MAIEEKAMIVVTCNGDPMCKQSFHREYYMRSEGKNVFNVDIQRHERVEHMWKKAFNDYYYIKQGRDEIEKRLKKEGWHVSKGKSLCKNCKVNWLEEWLQENEGNSPDQVQYVEQLSSTAPLDHVETPDGEIYSYVPEIEEI